MPIVQVQMMEGRTEAQKEALIEKVTEAVHEAVNAPVDHIRVLIQELPKTHWGIAGKSAKRLGR
ncbi:MAG TPA: 4-oxalocrotonate tautomerase [Nevskiaceae bacterium]|nr:4-oxalocrotonate tautomerase [Nevskiaceae bacterium]